MSDDPFTLARFEPLVGSRFTLRLNDDAALPAQLVEARAGGNHPLDGRQPFSLTFEAAGDTGLPQRIYRIEHAHLDAMDLFLVPVARTADGLRLEAVFG